MTNKHFDAIAAVLAGTRDPDYGDGRASVPNAILDQVALRLAEYLATLNPAFNRARFLRACRGEA